MVAAVTMSLVFAVGCDRGSHPETVGKLAPLFVMSDGVQTVDMGKLKGKVVVLNLWATWCVPCVAELPSLVALAGKLAAAGIVVLPLSDDRGGAPVVQRFYQTHSIAGLGVWLDPKGMAAEALGARGLPTTIIIDRQGRERARLEGGADWASAEAVAAVIRLAG